MWVTPRISHHNSCLCMSYEILRMGNQESAFLLLADYSLRIVSLSHCSGTSLNWTPWPWWSGWGASGHATAPQQPFSDTLCVNLFTSWFGLGWYHPFKNIGFDLQAYHLTLPPVHPNCLCQAFIRMKKHTDLNVVRKWRQRRKRRKRTSLYHC